MIEEINKRKVKIALTLEGRYIQGKQNIEDIEGSIEEPQNKQIENSDEKLKKDTFTVGCFQLAVIKLPWYKRAFKSLMKFLRIDYEFYEF